jgi:hypothetical protein
MKRRNDNGGEQRKRVVSSLSHPQSTSARDVRHRKQQSACRQPAPANATRKHEIKGTKYRVHGTAEYEVGRTEVNLHAFLISALMHTGNQTPGVHPQLLTLLTEQSREIMMMATITNLARKHKFYDVRVHTVKAIPVKHFLDCV